MTVASGDIRVCKVCLPTPQHSIQLAGFGKPRLPAGGDEGFFVSLKGKIQTYKEIPRMNSYNPAISPHRHPKPVTNHSGHPGGEAQSPHPHSHLALPRASTGLQAGPGRSGASVFEGPSDSGPAGAQLSQRWVRNAGFQVQDSFFGFLSPRSYFED